MIRQSIVCQSDLQIKCVKMKYEGEISLQLLFLS